MNFCQNTSVVFAKVIAKKNFYQLFLKNSSVVNKGKLFGALLTDLSKAFYCLSHELLRAKCHVFCIIKVDS